MTYFHFRFYSNTSFFSRNINFLYSGYAVSSVSLVSFALFSSPLAYNQGELLKWGTYLIQYYHFCYHYFQYRFLIHECYLLFYSKLFHSSISSSFHCLFRLLCCPFNSTFLFFCERAYFVIFMKPLKFMCGHCTGYFSDNLLPLDVIPIVFAECFSIKPLLLVNEATFVQRCCLSSLFLSSGRCPS